MEKLLRVGVITATHGLAGEVKVFPTTDDPTRYDDLTDVLIGTEKAQIPAKVKRVKYFKQFVIVSFEGLDRIEKVEPLIKKEIYVTRENAVPLEEDEYYVADLLNMKVVTDEGEELGYLKEVLPTGANDVYVVDTGKGEVLIPAIYECILKVDLEKAEMTVHLMEGLV